MGQPTLFVYSNVDSIIVVVAINFPFGVVALATLHSIAIAAGAAFIITALVVGISYIVCVTLTLALTWLARAYMFGGFSEHCSQVCLASGAPGGECNKYGLLPSCLQLEPDGFLPWA